MGKHNIKYIPSIEFNDETLFGNEAAEDEQDEVFSAYAYKRPEVGRFCDPGRTIQIARAYKGEGKSALIRLAGSVVRNRKGEKPLIVDTTGPNLSPEVDDANFDKWLRAWKASILNLAANEIGSKIGVAWTDDAISLVETAERNGYRSRRFVSAILDRLIPDTLIKRHRIEMPNAETLLKRWQATPPNVWFFIDDLDRNFENTEKSIVKLAAFFDACRQIANSVPGFRFRLAIRPNTWTTIKLRSEALSHVEQYTADLAWSERDILMLLSRRIEGYLQRTNQLSKLRDQLPADETERAKQLVEYAFESPVQWGEGRRPVHVPLYTLAQHRPRWLIELCRIAAQRAHGASHTKIQKIDFVGELSEFGQRRLEDTIAEFRPQCPQIGEILDAFRGQSEEFRTDELLKLIQNRIIEHVSPTIVGVQQKANHRQVAAFLFQIGFLFARRNLPDGTYEHISYIQQPSLLTSRTDMDSGVSWEIPPVFRQALELRNAEGSERSTASRNQQRTH